LLIILIMLTGTTTFQAELKRALEVANKCSEALDFLLKEARDTGGADLAQFMRISKANKHCGEAMDRFIIVYGAYKNVRTA